MNRDNTLRNKLLKTDRSLWIKQTLQKKDTEDRFLKLYKQISTGIWGRSKKTEERKSLIYHYETLSFLQLSVQNIL